MNQRAERAFTLIELLIVIAIVGLIAGVAVPSMMTIQRHAAARAAAGEFRAIFSLCRMRAIARGQHAGVKFSQSGGTWVYALYDDGNGNGIRNADISSGVDRCFSPARRVMPQGSRAFIALPPFSIIDPDGDALPPTKPPVQFGTSTICSFSPFGQATPGTVYLSDAVGEAYAVRIFGTTAKVRLLRWIPGTRRWEAR